MVEWLRLHTAKAGGAGSIPGLETKVSDTGSVAKGFGKKDYIFFLLKKKKIRRSQWSAHSGERMKNLSSYHND